ncbi:MAG: class I SAM-dependent methyltransferase [Rhodospirillaceae bacterium]|nr:class I SAM-dependent methyltransferase [Rhodospirillaceae bacterium]
MHLSSYQHMQDLIGRYLDRGRRLEILDIGSSDVVDPDPAQPGSYRPLFENPGWRYRGIDIAPGKNVDIVMSDPNRLPLPGGTADLIVSGQAFEHAEFFWVLFLEMARVTKPGGHIFLIAPSRGPEHRYPTDCWRFYPDGYRALAKYSGLELVEVTTDWAPHPVPDSAQWGDTVGVFRRPPGGSWRAALRGALVGLASRIV